MDFLDTLILDGTKFLGESLALRIILREYKLSIRIFGAWCVFFCTFQGEKLRNYNFLKRIFF